MRKKPKIDMSAAAVTARLRQASNLSQVERLATIIRSAVAEIRGEKVIPELEFWQLREPAKKVR